MLKRLALSCVALALALVLGEISLRVAASWRWRQESRAAAMVPQSTNKHHTTLAELVAPDADPRLVYSLRPGLDLIFKDVEVKTNSYGLRERELSFAPDAAELRIVGLGDSVAFGWGVPITKSYLRTAEVLLQEHIPDKRITTVNCGVPGYNTVMEVEQYSRLGQRFKPELIILHFINNDLEIPRFLAAPPRVRSWRRSFLLQSLRELHLPRLNRQLIDPADVEGFATSHGRDLAGEYEPFSGPEAFVTAMRRLRDLRHNTPVLCLLLTREGDPWRLYANTAEECGFLVVETAPAYQAYLASHCPHPDSACWRRTFWRSEKDPHPNVLGHRLIAETLVKAIVSHGLLPGIR